MGALIARLYSAIVPIGEISSDCNLYLLSSPPFFLGLSCFSFSLFLRRRFLPFPPTDETVTCFDRWLVTSLFALPRRIF